MTEFNIDSLLDGTLDDLAELPEFRLFPAGTHRMMFSLEVDAKDKTIYHGKCKLLETIELADATATPLEAGAENSIRYDMKNEFSQGKLRKILAVAAEHFGTKSNRELIAEMNGVEILAVTSLTESKKKPGSFFMDIVEMQIV